jgi:hypothetical protein
MKQSYNQTYNDSRSRSVNSLLYDNIFLYESMSDPVIASDGFTYDRKNIENWIGVLKNKTSPTTGAILKNITLIPNQSFTLDPNEMFFDPISGIMMIDPVVASDGFTYERENLLNFINRNVTMGKTGFFVPSPMTKQPMPDSGYTDGSDFIPNYSLKSAINQWKAEHPLAGFRPNKLNGMPRFSSGYNGTMKTPANYGIRDKDVYDMHNYHRDSHPKSPYRIKQRLDDSAIITANGWGGGKKRSYRTTRKPRKLNIRGRRASRRTNNRRNAKK